MKGVRRTDSKKKIAPRYVRPFEILDRIGLDAYRLTLPPVLEIMHNVFHVSQLRKYVPDHDHIISYGPLQIQKDMSYTEEPVQILDRKEIIEKQNYFFGQDFMDE